MGGAGGGGQVSEIERSTSEGLIYVWLEHDPAAAAADVTIPDIPGINDLDQIADAIRDGRVGRYLPVTLHFADHPAPGPKRVRAVDVARLLRDRNIRHRRRYEVMIGAFDDPDTGD